VGPPIAFSLSKGKHLLQQVAHDVRYGSGQPAVEKHSTATTANIRYNMIIIIIIIINIISTAKTKHQPTTTTTTTTTTLEIAKKHKTITSILKVVS
jgi:hypothetical protein